jgi:glycosyltransferase involved in cell wall biosynthesis
MRIGFITPEYVTEPYFSGGLANYLHRTASALAARGHEVHLFTLSPVGNATFSTSGVTVHRIAAGALQRWVKKASRGRLQEAAEWVDFSFAAYKRAAHVHRNTPFDVVQVPNYSACGLVSTLFLRAPTVVRLSTYGPAWNDHAAIARTLDRTASEWLEGLQLRLARYVYAPTEYVRRLAYGKASLDGIEVIQTPFYLEQGEVDASIYREHLEGRKYLLFFGRLQPHKGVHVLASALPGVFDANPGCVAAFVGMDLPSALAPSMLAHIKHLCAGFEDRLLFLDQIPHAQLYPIISHAHVIVLPSLIDNLPNACLEAMGLGKAVVGTTGTSFDEIIEDGVTGFLVPPGDVSALAAKVNEVWRRSDLTAIGCAARDSVARLHPERTITRLEEYYERVVAASSGVDNAAHHLSAG